MAARKPKNALEVKGLNKIYDGSKKSPPTHALKDIDLTVPTGSMFALLGPNGAGKSTLINILAGLVDKTSGNASIWGYDIDEHRRQSKATIGIVPQELNLDAFFTPIEIIDLQAGLYGIPKKDRQSEQLLNLVGLADKANTYSRKLSGGMKRRLMIAKAMVHSPPILILDEPTAGVDIELRQQLWNNVRELNKQGVTILLTTHYLEEAQELCDTIAIINHGKVVACENKEDMLKHFDQKEMIVTLKKKIGRLPKSLKDIGASKLKTGQIKIIYRPSKISTDEILSLLQKESLTIQDLSTKEADLEDVFLSVTGNGN